jgi:hypothetical protein
VHLNRLKVRISLLLFISLLDLASPVHSSTTVSFMTTILRRVYGLTKGQDFLLRTATHNIPSTESDQRILTYVLRGSHLCVKSRRQTYREIMNNCVRKRMMTCTNGLYSWSDILLKHMRSVCRVVLSMACSYFLGRRRETQ